MTKRECVIEVLKGGKPPVVPSLGETPMDATVAASLAGLMPKPTGDPVTDAVNRALFYDNSVLGVGIDVAAETLVKTDERHVYRYETGVVWTDQYIPTYNRSAGNYPVETPEQAFTFQMPVFDDGARFNKKELAERINRIKDAGYYAEGHIIGAWSAVYYYMARFESALEWMLTEPEACERLFKHAIDFSVKSAEVLLECGVDGINSFSDMGTAISTLYSRQCFDRYMYNWLKSISALCHDNDAFFHLHCHGHIEDFMDKIVEAGVDIINPIGPSDYNDLAMFKRKWGDRINIMGGISTTIMDMDDGAMRAHVREVMDIGRKGGRFFPRTESGIPPMPREKIMLYLEILKDERMKGYT